jgi:hypothetical protein
MLQISLPDGTVVSHPENATPLSVAESIGSRLAKAVVAAKLGIALSMRRFRSDPTRGHPQFLSVC